jgi:hypothetical protein
MYMGPGAPVIEELRMRGPRSELIQIIACIRPPPLTNIIGKGIEPGIAPVRYPATAGVSSRKRKAIRDLWGGAFRRPVRRTAGSPTAFAAIGFIVFV